MSDEFIPNHDNPFDFPIMGLNEWILFLQKHTSYDHNSDLAWGLSKWPCITYHTMKKKHGDNIEEMIDHLRRLGAFGVRLGKSIRISQLERSLALSVNELTGSNIDNIDIDGYIILASSNNVTLKVTVEKLFKIIYPDNCQYDVGTDSFTENAHTTYYYDFNTGVLIYILETNGFIDDVSIFESFEFVPDRERFDKPKSIPN